MDLQTHSFFRSGKYREDYETLLNFNLLIQEIYLPTNKNKRKQVLTERILFFFVLDLVLRLPCGKKAVFGSASDFSGDFGNFFLW